MAWEETRASYRKMKALWAGLNTEERDEAVTQLMLKGLGGMMVGGALTYQFGWPAVVLLAGLILCRIGDA